MTVKEQVLEHHNNALKENRIVFGTFLQGSQNYKLENEFSDVDTKSIIIPSIEEVILNKKAVSTTSVMPDNSHNDLKDIRVMFRTFEKQNINFLEILFTEYYIYNPLFEDEFWELRDMSDEVVNINWNQLLRCISGMSKEKLHAMEHPYPTIIDKIKKYGYDPKQLHHIVRLNEFMCRLADNVSFKDCLFSQKREYLDYIKRGNLPLEEARKLAVEMDKATNNLRIELSYEKDLIKQSVIDSLYDLLARIVKKSFRMELA